MRLLPLAIALLSVACAASALVGCAHSPDGRLDYAEVASQREGRSLRYGVYEPPGWDRTTPLPLVLLLHGAGDDETSADRSAVTDRLDRAITAGRLPPFLMVAPDGDRGLWMDWYDGSHRFKSWVLDDVVPSVRRSHAVVDGPAGLHLVGVSMGGGGGIQMWLEDPARFASATIVSAPILGEAGTRAFLGAYMEPEVMLRVFGPPGSGSGVDPYVALASRASLEGSRLVFGAAAFDLGVIRDSNAAFHAHLQKAGVPHRYVQFSGFHNWSSWAAMLEYSLCQQLQAQCAMPIPGRWMVRGVD